MNYVKTLIALIVLALLGAYAYKLNEAPVETDDAKKKTFAEFAFDQATNIQIQKSGETSPIEFSRAGIGSDWMMKKPVDSLVDQSAVNEITGDLMVAKSDLVIPAAEVEKPEHFGLGTDAVKLTVKAGTAETVLYYGKKNPEGNLFYARAGESKDVFGLDTKIFNSVNKRTNDYRDKKIASVAATGATFLELSYPGGNKETFKFKKNQDTWYMEAPKAGRCDNQEVQNILNKLQMTSAAKFVDPHEAAYNEPSIAENAAEILIKCGAAATGEVATVIAIGKDTADNMCFLKSNYRKELILTDKSVKAELVKKLESFSPKTCVDFNTSNANTIVLKPADTVSTELKKVGSEWKVAKQGTFSVEVAADTARVENLLQKVRECKALSVVENTSSVELISDFEKATLEVRVGLSFSDRTESVFLIPGNHAKHAYARGDSRNILYGAQKDQLDEILRLAKEITENKK